MSKQAGHIKKRCMACYCVANHHLFPDPRPRKRLSAKLAVCTHCFRFRYRSYWCAAEILTLNTPKKAGRMLDALDAELKARRED